MATYHASPSGDESFGKKMKRIFANRAVVVTVVTLLLAVTVIAVATVAANRARKPGPDTAGTDTEAATKAPGGLDVFREEDTLPTYHGGATEALEAGTDAPDPLQLSLPADGLLTKGHDASVQVWSDTMGDYRVHLGVDIATAENAPVKAAADGIIERIWNDPLMGTCLAVSHGEEVVTVYKNLSAVLPEGVAEGTAVSRGRCIGYVGDTAISEMAEEPHLHMEVTVNGIQTDPMTMFSAADAAALKNETADAAYESSASGK